MQVMTWIRVQADRVGAMVLVAAGIVVLFVGWNQVSNALLTTEQIPYLMSAGMFGIVLVGIGSVLWLSADLRDEWRALKRIEEEMRAARQGAAGVTEVVVAADTALMVERPARRVASVAEST